MLSSFGKCFSENSIAADVVGLRSPDRRPQLNSRAQWHKQPPVHRRCVDDQQRRREGSSGCCCSSSGDVSLPAAAVRPDPPETSATEPVDTERLKSIQQRIKQQQAAMPASSYSLSQTQRLVESAMLAAVSGLAYALATTMHLESYMGYFLPLPIVLSSLRSGPAAGRKTMTTTFFLLLVLLGPVKALSYVFNHGLMAATLGTTWAYRMSWLPSIALGSLARLAGYAGFIAIWGWTLHENMFLLLVTNSCSTVEQMMALVGHSGSVSPNVIVTIIVCLLIVNAVFYLFFMHIVYHILLQSMGFQLPPPPRLVDKFMLKGR